MRRRLVVLTQHQHKELLLVRDHDRDPDMRLRAAAILKVAAGETMTQVGQHLLNRPVCDDTIARWIGRYQQEGVDGLRIRAGRGRKPAFFPCDGPRARIGRRTGARGSLSHA